MEYKLDISNNLPLIKHFNRYINAHREFYNLNINQRIITTLDNTECTVYLQPLQFNDKTHNVEGEIHTDYSISKVQGQDVENYQFVIVVKNRKTNDTESYINLIKQFNEREARHGDQVQLNYYKILNQQLTVHNFYNKPVFEWINDVDILKKEFFSPHKKYLFDVMTQKTKNGNWSNLILHGEPGTGKSSFVYRLATYCKMSIISVDISLYIDKKRELYSIFHANEFSLPNDQKKHSVNTNCIIILEEFDSSIEKIAQLENIFQFKSNTINNYISGKTRDIEEKVNKFVAKEVTDAKVNYQIPLENRSTEQFIRHKMANQEIDPNKISNDISDIVRTFSDDNKSDILRLRDLLELFQGPVPIKDRIIVATTNNFEKIRNIIPELFRPGRLTPIKFTYLDWDSLNDLVSYYFGCEIPCKQFEVKIPTSQITELAIKYTCLNKSVNVAISTGESAFNNFLTELIEQNNKCQEQQSAHQPVQQSAHQSVQQSVQQPVQQSVQQPAHQPVQQSTYQSAHQPAHQPAQKPTLVSRTDLRNHHISLSDIQKKDKKEEAQMHEQIYSKAFSTGTSIEESLENWQRMAMMMPHGEHDEY